MQSSLFSQVNAQGVDGLTAEFYKKFWEELADSFLEMCDRALAVGHLPNTGRAGILSLLEKPGKPKQFIKNWRPLTLLTVDNKIITKTIASRLQPIVHKYVG